LKDEAEMEAIADALEKTHWCRKDAAKMLGISYKALLYKIRQFGLDTGRPARASNKKVIAGGGGGSSNSGSSGSSGGTGSLPNDLAPAGRHS
jgi:hypothetical protein